jgi:hypothetical protein
MLVDRTAGRVARNQSMFRDANERIEQSAEELLEDTAAAVPFICECPEPTCTSIARLSLVDYEMVRSRGDWFFAVPGHEVCVVDGEEVATIVKRYAGYSLMEKTAPQARPQNGLIRAGSWEAEPRPGGCVQLSSRLVRQLTAAVT